MDKFFGILFTIIALVLFSMPSHAEVLLQENRLTINVQEATVHEVLRALTQQSQINIIALEETDVGNVRISKKFWGLPLEEGIHRVLNGWNYGITRDVSTGKITALYLVSQRIHASTSGSPPTASSSYPSNQNISQLQTQPTALSQTYGTDAIHPINEEELDGNDDFFNDEEQESLPPNLSETLERWQRNGNG